MEYEEHCVIVKEPGDVYVDHVTPDKGTVHSISDQIITFLRDLQGTPVNTGRHAGGAIKLIELYLDKHLPFTDK